MTKAVVNYPLLVDLDGSLLKSDMLYESLVRTLWAQPWLVFLLPIWLLKGKAFLKEQLAIRANIDYAALPYRQNVVDFIQEQRQQDRKIILCTGTWQPQAERIAETLGLFDEVHGTTVNHNLTGIDKANWAVDRFGEKGFSYIGNELKDMHVWRKAATAIVVTNGPELETAAASVCDVESVFDSGKTDLKVALKAIRIHQWVKNFLIFIPLLTSHLFVSTEAIVNSLIAFMVFCCCASATYILNDLADLDSDRNHRSKNARPLASGNISIKAATLLAGGLFVVGFALAGLLPVGFILSLFAYLAVTLAYSFRLKRLQTVDVIVLAGLYTLRVIAGASAIGIAASFWLLSFSMFLFISLAIAKRVSELIKTRSESPDNFEIRGRGYYVTDIEVLLSLGSSSGLMSVLVFALYIRSDEIVSLYSIPEMLWLVCPVLAYWMMRIIMLTARNELDEDPISFAIKDRNSWVVGVLVLALMFAAS